MKTIHWFKTCLQNKHYFLLHFQQILKYIHRVVYCFGSLVGDMVYRLSCSLQYLMLNGSMLFVDMFAIQLSADELLKAMENVPSASVGFMDGDQGPWLELGPALLQGVNHQVDDLFLIISLSPVLPSKSVTTSLKTWQFTIQLMSIDI